MSKIEHARSPASNGGRTKQPSLFVVPAPPKNRLRFSPDLIGTVTVTVTGAALLGGLPFGVAGAVIGGVLGFALGVYNERN
jgi:hypothetical protein